ncbi:MAG: TIR-like protein FxsC [Caldimonas sp.]
MGSEFFFSYTRGNNDLYLKKFFTDLSEEVRNRRGLPAGTEVGFFDQRNLELGEDWDAALVEALQSCKVMIAIASPGYWTSEYCGKEWAVFRARLAQAAGPGAKLPPLLKPVVWLPFAFDTLPAAVAGGQLTFGDPHATHNVEGLRYLLKRIDEQRSAYEDVVESLAKEIIKAADQHPLPPLAAVPRLGQIAAAFPAKAAPAAAAAGGAAPAPLPSPSGPKHVAFIYVAAHPQAFGAARKAEPYVDVGGPDWKPFYPVSTTRVHRFVQSVVAGDDLDFTSEALPFGANLIDRIDEAWRQRQIVVLIVDPWSLHWDAQRATPEYQTLLKALDSRLDYHWCVLVPWNESDAEAMADRAAITATVRDTFDRHANLAPNPMFYRDGIKNADELRTALGDVLTRLKEEIKKRAPVSMPIPAGPAKTVVTGPSTS